MNQQLKDYKSMFNNGGVVQCLFNNIILPGRAGYEVIDNVPKMEKAPEVG